MKSESNRPITIEDLLRLKRAERPPTEFWATFDRELRAKQLSALVEKRPWWQGVPGAFRRMMRYRVALGVSVIAVLTILSLQDHETPASATSEFGIEPSAQPIASVVVPSQQVTTPTAAATASVAAIEVVQPVQVVALAGFSGPEEAASARVLPAAEEVVEASPEFQSPRRATENMTVVQDADRSTARSLLAVASGFEDRAMPSRVAVEPLQQMTPPSESRRARLLTAMVSMASLESSLRTTERAANRMAQERLYDDSISRFDARGDRLQVKF